jgi:hypothetical protein
METGKWKLARYFLVSNFQFLISSFQVLVSLIAPQIVDLLPYFSL